MRSSEHLVISEDFNDWRRKPRLTLGGLLLILGLGLPAIGGTAYFVATLPGEVEPKPTLYFHVDPGHTTWGVADEIHIDGDLLINGKRIKESCLEDAE